MENVFGAGGLQVYGEPWSVVSSRNFNADEIAAVRSTCIVDSKFGKSVCFFLKGGGQSYIPVSNTGAEAVLGASINMSTAKLVKLHREGDGTIMRVEL